MNKLQIDIVSDVMCPWCIVGYKGLELALNNLPPDVEATINWLPFELNPKMPIEGQDIEEHLIEKYGITKQQSAQNREMITQRGKEVDFDFNFSQHMRMINSFDLHRLLAWAKVQGKQHELQMALFSAHFTKNIPLNEHENLIKIVGSLGLDIIVANDLLNSNIYSEQVRIEQNISLKNGIKAVPTFIINNNFSISGGQTTETFKQILEELVQEI
jgi:predicted DsbA family dithiol-disulfide isomerase